MTRPSSELRTLSYSKQRFDPKQWLNFVQLKPFEKAWKKIGLGDDALRALEIAIMVDPEVHPVIPETGGLRKLRFAPEHWSKGKRGALRVCYVYFKAYGLIALVTVYHKVEKEILSRSEMKRIKELITEIERYLKQGKC